MNEDPDAMFNRLIKTDENFRFLHECLEWVREKLVRHIRLIYAESRHLA